MPSDTVVCGTGLLGIINKVCDSVPTPYRLLRTVLHVPDDPRKPANLAIFPCCVVSGELRAGDDALEAAWFRLDALPEEIGFDNREVVLAPLARRLRDGCGVASAEWP